MNDIKDKCNEITQFLIDSNVTKEKATECIYYLYAATVAQQLEDNDSSMIHQEVIFDDCKLTIVVFRETVN